MDIVISNGSPLPIYEQITTQIRDAIIAGELAEGEQLPSIRALANDLRVSVITTKRAYSDLEEQGFVETVPGCFVAGGNEELVREERLRSIEELLSEAIDRARQVDIDVSELHEMIDLLADE